jgi:hypothetical protein
MELLGFYDVIRRRTDERARFGTAINNLAADRQGLASAADGVAASASNASFGDDVLAGAARLSAISNSLTAALHANAEAIARTRKELQDAQSRERLIRIAIFVGVGLIVAVAAIWLFS